MQKQQAVLLDVFQIAQQNQLMGSNVEEIPLLIPLNAFR